KDRETTVILSDSRTAAVGKHGWATRLDDGRIMRGHDVRAEIEFARRDADDSYQKRGNEPHHHNLEVGGTVCRVHRPVHDVLRGSPPFVAKVPKRSSIIRADQRKNELPVPKNASRISESP